LITLSFRHYITPLRHYWHYYAINIDAIIITDISCHWYWLLLHYWHYAIITTLLLPLSHYYIDITLYTLHAIDAINTPLLLITPLRHIIDYWLLTLRHYYYYYWLLRHWLRHWCHIDTLLLSTHWHYITLMPLLTLLAIIDAITPLLTLLRHYYWCHYYWLLLHIDIAITLTLLRHYITGH
jgi:hypothetical protein